MPDGVRALLERERNGVLATLSASRAGWPFGSVAAFALSDQGEPILLFSRLAEHTRNLQADPRASLLVQDAASRDDPQAGARVTLLGTIEPVTAADGASAESRYLAKHPQAVHYLSLGDFRLYILRVTAARYINTFGAMGWIDGDRLRAELVA